MNNINNFSVIIPCYNSSKTIIETLKSLANQTYKDFEIVISDDCSNDNSLEKISKLKIKNLKLIKNNINRGYGPNLEIARKNAKYDKIFIIAQDDCIAPKTLEDYNKIYNSNKLIGGIVRSFYEYTNNIKKPVRVRSALFMQQSPRLVNLNSDYSEIENIFFLAGNLSGLSFINSKTKVPINKDIWPAHAYPFLDILKNYYLAVFPKYNTAIRLHSNQSTFSFAYKESPSIQWARMFNKILVEKKHKKIKEKLIENFIGKNYIGLVQIKNFSSYNNLFFEIYYLIKLRKKNIFSLVFWFFAIGTILVPRTVLLGLVREYKEKINSLMYKKIKLYK